MKQLSFFNQAQVKRAGGLPFADGACLRLSHEWLAGQFTGRPLEEQRLKADTIRSDQSSYLVSADKVLTSTTLGDRQVADGVTRMSALALSGWARSGRYEYADGMHTFQDFFASPNTDGVIGLFGKDAAGARWAHAIAIFHGDSFFDANSGEWELQGAPSTRALDMVTYCRGPRVCFGAGDLITHVRFMLRQ